MKKIILSLLFISFGVFTASSQWTDDPLLNSVVNNLSGSQAVPHIAYDDVGNFYVGFYSNNAGNYDIRLQYFSYDGVAQWDTDGLLVSNHTQYSWVTEWDLTTDNNGNCVLAFNDARDGNANVYAYAISPSGEFLWGNDGISLTSDPLDEFVPSITVTGSNNVIVAWSRPTSPQAEIVMQKITPSGTLSWGTSGITYQSGSESYTGARVLGVEGDNFIMAFYKETGSFPAITRHIYTQKFTGSGTPLWFGDVLASNSNYINPYNNFKIAPDNNNGIIIAWMDDRDGDMNMDGAVQRVNGDGSINWPANGSEVSTQNNYSHQQVEILGVNNVDEVLVTWSKKNQSQSQTAIAGQKFSSTGEQLWTTGGKEFIPMSSDISGVGGGGVFDGENSLIIYEEYVSGVSYSHVKAFAVDNMGAFMWFPTTTLMAGRTTSKVHLVVSSLLNEQLIAVWEEGSASDIYMQNIFTNGSMGEPPISSDATLSDLTINGETIEDFDPMVIYYEVDVEEGQAVPLIDGTVNNVFASMEITQSPAVPGDATIVVTAQDETTQITYTVHFNLVTGIFGAKDEMISIFPNPVIDKFKVSGLKEDAKIEIVDLLGKKIISKTINENAVVDISVLQQGIYFVMIHHSNGNITSQKIIKK